MNPEISNPLRHLKQICFSTPRKCTAGKRHVYVDGVCACGKMSRAEENRLRNKAQAEIEAYERELHD